MNVSVPVNTTATLYLPAKPGSLIYECGQPVDKVKGIKYKREELGKSIFEVGSGNYAFQFLH